MYGNNFQPQFQQPFQPQYQNPYQFTNRNQSIELIRVNGIDGARAYQMPANSQVALFDSNNDIMYIKVTDGAGFATVRTFKFSEIVEK